MRAVLSMLFDQAIRIIIVGFNVIVVGDTLQSAQVIVSYHRIAV